MEREGEAGVTGKCGGKLLGLKRERALKTKNYCLQVINYRDWVHAIEDLAGPSNDDRSS